MNARERAIEILEQEVGYGELTDDGSTHDERIIAEFDAAGLVIVSRERLAGIIRRIVRERKSWRSMAEIQAKITNQACRIIARFWRVLRMSRAQTKRARSDLRFEREWNRRRVAELQQKHEPVTPEELLRSGGHWLGAARTWITWHRCQGNGETVTWGSSEEIRPPLLMREVEEIAAHAAAAAITDCRDNVIAERDAAIAERDTWRDRYEAQCEDVESLQRTAERLQAEAETARAERDETRREREEMRYERNAALHDRDTAIRALRHVVKVLEDLSACECCGHDGDDESGEHYEDCMRCRVDEALAYAEAVLHPDRPLGDVSQPTPDGQPPRRPPARAPSPASRPRRP